MRTFEEIKEYVDQYMNEFEDETNFNEEEKLLKSFLIFNF